MPTDDLAAEIAAHRTQNGVACRACGGLWPCLVRRLAEREALTRGELDAAYEMATRMTQERDALLAAARIAVDGLTAADICHGPDFDSESWGNDCDVCRVMRPLVRTLAPTDGEQPA